MSKQLVSLSRPAPAVWQITLENGPDNRLVPALLTQMGVLLDTVEAEWREKGGGKKAGESKEGAGALVITSAYPKFFSNGLDPSVLGVAGFFEDVYDPLMYRLLTFPLVTIAAVNGHAFAGGMVLALSCDYRVMNKSKGMMCMNELLIGLPLPASFATFLRLRLEPTVLRETMLAKRWTQPELLKERLVDELADEDKVVSRAIELGVQLGPRIASGSWGSIKDGLWHDVIDQSRTRRAVIMPAMEGKVFWERIKREKGKL